MRRKLFRFSPLIIALLLTACGTVATPTPVDVVDDDEESAVVDEEPTEVPEVAIEPTEVAATEPEEDETSSALDGDPTRGESLFVSNTCNACHSTTSADALVGPGLLDIFDRAATRVEGQSAIDYIQESIVDPDAFIVEGFTAGIMPQHFGNVLTDADFGDLLTYMSTFTSDVAGSEEAAVDDAETTTDTEEEVVADDTEAATDIEEEVVAADGGDPANGRELFTSLSCFACHSNTSNDTIVGPGLRSISERAGSRISGLSATEYVRQSILDPNAFVVEGFPPNTMPQNFRDEVTDAELDDLIAYLFSLADRVDIPEQPTAPEEVEEETAPEADIVAIGGEAAENGLRLFNSNGCSGCHSNVSNDRIVGPGLLDIAERAGDRVEGLTAEQYIRQSILDPNAFVVEGFPPNTMPQHFASVLLDEEINDLITYLFALSENTPDLSVADNRVRS